MKTVARRFAGLACLLALSIQPCLSCVLGSIPDDHEAARAGERCESAVQQISVENCTPPAVVPALASSRISAPFFALPAKTGAAADVAVDAGRALRHMAASPGGGPPAWLRNSTLLI